MGDEGNWSESYAEQLRLLFRQAPIALAVNLAIAATVAAVLAPIAGTWPVIIWFASMLTVICFRYAVYQWYSHPEWLKGSVRRWDTFSILGAGLTGSIWGIGGALLLPPQTVQQVFVVLTIGGMCTGAVVLHSSHFPTLFSFVLPATVPVAARFILEGTPSQVGLGGMMLVFAGALSVAGYNHNRCLVEALRLKLDLARYARDLESTNARLLRESSERRAAQEMLRQTEKMNALGQLTGGLAHDFNNLLTVIMRGLGLLRSSAKDERSSRGLSAAIEAAARAAKLTHSLLSFARRQQFKVELENVNRLIGGFDNVLRNAISERVALQPCRVDPSYFQTALLNLVLNARDALPSGAGTVTIETQNARVNAREAARYPELKPGDYVTVAVIDDGVGMPPEVMARAFEPFYTTKGVGAGTGLGLSQVYGFVTQSGGSVKITSVPNEGTVVLMLLPAERERPQIGSETETNFGADSAKVEATVMVLEDDALLRSLVAEDLTDLGYRVLTAEDGQSALAQLRRGEAVDLLLSDLVMPKENGDEIAIQAVDLRPNLKVLLMSGYSPARHENALRFPFLRKPFQQDELAEAVRNVLAA